MLYYYISIIGAGPAGSTCALRLKQLGCKNVLLIEADDHERFRIGESISPDTNTLLKDLGLFQNFLNDKHEPCYGSCSWWGDNRRGFNDFILSPYGHGWHLNRRIFDASLVKKAEQAGAVVSKKTRFVSYTTLNSGGFSLQLNQGGIRKEVTTEIVIDASGSRGVFAAQQGSKKISDDTLICLAMRYTITTDKEIPQQTFLAACEDGWWYATRIPNNLLLVTLYTHADIIKSKKLNRLENLQAVLKNTLPIFALTEKLVCRDSKPLGFEAPAYCLNKLQGENWVAIADAASCYDPITSQGITKAITEGKKVAEMLMENPKNFSSFQQNVHAQYIQYQAARIKFYQMEKRWNDAPFWRKMNNLQPISFSS